MGFPYATLQAAAIDCYGALFPTFTNVTSTTLGIKPTGTAFYTALLTTFPKTNTNNQPCANALQIFAAKITALPAPAGGVVPDLQTFFNIVLACYKLLWMTYQLNAQGLITSTQSAAVLTAFNSAFGSG